MSSHSPSWGSWKCCRTSRGITRYCGQFRAQLRSGSVRLLICVDYPGFNMKLAAAAHDARVPVLYYITPQVWAWGARRLPRLARTVTRAAVILPFEEPTARASTGSTRRSSGIRSSTGSPSMPERAAARSNWVWRPATACSHFFRAAARRKSPGTSTIRGRGP